jgi:ZIP family zinc transporter
MNNILQLLGYAIIPALTMTFAGIWAIWRAPNENWRSALMHFAAGVVFAVLAIEFLPDLVHEHSALVTGIGFALGAATMLGIRTWSERGNRKAPKNGVQVSGSLIAASAVDISIDGLMLGIGFAAGAKQGILLTIALAFELTSLGLAIALELQQGKIARRRIVQSVVMLSVLFILSAGIGSVVLSFISGSLLVGMIAFGAAALLFLVTEELLTEAHEVTENPWLTASFFVGFLVILMLELVN